jgi:hypothetical protein
MGADHVELSGRRAALPASVRVRVRFQDFPHSVKTIIISMGYVVFGAPRREVRRVRNINGLAKSGTMNRSIAFQGFTRASVPPRSGRLDADQRPLKSSALQRFRPVTEALPQSRRGAREACS